MKKSSVLMFTALCSVLLIAVTSCENIELTDEIEASASRSAAGNYETYTLSSEICKLVKQGYNQGEKGPVIITKGTLVKGSSTKAVYLVTLAGTEFTENQSTDAISDILSAFNLDNKYYQNVVNIVTSNIPSGSNLVFAGHSLGGMVCQQVIANDTVKKNYNVLNTVTFGSPLLSAGSREGTVKRLGDTSDPVPYLSGSIINNTVWAIAGLNRENGGYGTDFYGAHSKSYLRSDVWGKYDVTGTKNGSAELILDMDSETYYKCPVDVTE